MQLHSPRKYFTALTLSLAPTVKCSSKLHHIIFIKSSATAGMADRGVTRTETIHLIEEDSISASRSVLPSKKPAVHCANLHAKYSSIRLGVITHSILL